MVFIIKVLHFQMRSLSEFLKTKLFKLDHFYLEIIIQQVKQFVKLLIRFFFPKLSRI
jgi:hypothetical protein